MFFKLMVPFLLTALQRVNSSPKLCLKESTPLKSFRSITQLANDSYLVTDGNHYSLFESDKYVNFSADYSKFETNDNSSFGSHQYKFDIVFVIDFDANCINVAEKVFFIDLKTEEVSQVFNKYSIFEKNQWMSPKGIISENMDSEALNQIENHIKSMEIFKSDIKLVLYFQSFGLLVIRAGDSELTYCSDKGWKVRKNALKSEINFENIDTGFVDNEEKRVYLFPIDRIGSDKKQHIRSVYFNCSYNLRTSEIDLKCVNKSLDSFCKSEDMNPKVENIDSFSYSEILLIILVTATMVVFVAILCLLCCPKRKEKRENSISKTTEVSTTNRTLVSGKASQAVTPSATPSATPDDTVISNDIKLNL